MPSVSKFVDVIKFGGSDFRVLISLTKYMHYVDDVASFLYRLTFERFTYMQIAMLSVDIVTALLRYDLKVAKDKMRELRDELLDLGLDDDDELVVELDYLMHRL